MSYTVDIWLRAFEEPVALECICKLKDDSLTFSRHLLKAFVLLTCYRIRVLLLNIFFMSSSARLYRYSFFCLSSSFYLLLSIEPIWNMCQCLSKWRFTMRCRIIAPFLTLSSGLNSTAIASWLLLIICGGLLPTAP